MKNKIQQYLMQFWLLLKRFWFLVVLSLTLMFVAYRIILKKLFPAFTSAECIQGHECSANFLEGYVSLLTLAIVIGGIVFAAWEYLRQESRISFQIYQSIHAKMTDPDEEAARRWIIVNIKPLDENESLEDWSKEFSKKVFEKPDDWKEELSPGHQYIKRTLKVHHFHFFY